jgi:hypothetical protein
MALGPARAYSDGQLDDTRGRPRQALLHRPPLRLTLEARASATPGGTLGFGFWNDPFPSWAGEAGAGRHLPASPRAIWFFHAAPPCELPFARRGPATGWTGSTLRGPALPGVLVAGLGAAAVAGMALPPLRTHLLAVYWRWFAGAQSDTIEGLDRWRTYQIDWKEDVATFEVDGRTILASRCPPASPLGLVMWIDNQWATFSRRRGIRFGVSPSFEESFLEVRRVRLNGIPLSAPVEAAHRPDG